MQKLSPLQLNTLFDNEGWPEFVDVRTPSIRSEPTAPSLIFDLIILPEISYFAGHFPEQAVLPGVVQVHWAAKLGLLWIAPDAERGFVLESAVQLNNIKFNAPVLPSCVLSLELVYKVEKRQIRFRYYNSQDTFSSGIVALGEPAANFELTAPQKPMADPMDIS